VLNDNLIDRGYTFKLLHFGSLGHDIRTSYIETIKGVESFDIRAFPGISLIDVINSFDPSVVLFLSTTSLLHQAIIRYCKYLNIPTLHLYHGVVGIMAPDMSLNTSFSYRAHFIRFISRITVNLHSIIPIYMQSIFKTRFHGFQIIPFLNFLLKAASGRSYLGEAAYDSATDAVCVYIDYDIIHASKRYHVPIKNIKAVGNLDIARFGLNEEHILSWKPSSCCSAIYLDSALSHASTCFNSDDDFISHLCQLRSILPCDLKLKIHPAHSLSTVFKLKSLGFTLIDNCDLVSEIQNSVVTFCEPSTISLIPAFIGSPVIFPRYGLLSTIRYGEIINSYPRHFTADSVDCIQNIIKRLSDYQFLESTHNNSLDWIRKYIGPLPAADFPLRVIDQIEMLICN